MFRVEMMNISHLDEVAQLEEDTFAIPWSRKQIEYEVRENERAVYLVALDSYDKVVGYCGMWHILDEGHITNVAVNIESRGLGIGNLLLKSLIKKSEELEITGITLEVRMSNSVAQKLYIKYGFRPEGLRKNYYTDTKEDAIIMWKYL